MTGDFIVTLTGGSPWGFRIRGGSETSQPVHVSRINGGGKAGKHGIREGDIIEAVNGQCLDGLSQIQVQQLVRNSGDSLTLNLRRDNELFSRLPPASDSRLAALSSEDREIPLESMSVEMYLKGNRDDCNNDVTGQQTSEGVRPISITISTSRNVPIAPMGPMFKAQATKAIWMPHQSSKEDESLSSPIKSEHILPISAENEKNHCQINGNKDDISSKKFNGSLNTLDTDGMEDKKITRKSMPVNVDPSTAINNVEFSDKPISKEAIIVDQKVTIEDGNIHQDTYYAIPYDKITTTKTMIKAPTYEGIGPTEDGLPTGLRTAVKKEYGSDWYKTMFRSLHRSEDQEDLNVQADGYMSDPELNRKDKPSGIKNRNKIIVTYKPHARPSNETKKSSYSFPAAKCSLQTYSHKPWIISDYEPGHSSITNNKSSYTNTKYLPPLNSPKPKYVYNDGYDSDSTLVRKTGKTHMLDPQQQKEWYQTVQKGGEIPLPGFCKPAPQKPQVPIVGPPPLVPSKWDADHYYNTYACKTDNLHAYSPLHSPVQSAKTSESSKKKLQDDFFTKLDEVLLNHHEDNTRQFSPKSLDAISDSPNRVVILYDFIAQSSRELSLHKGDIATIQRRIDKNWYEGKSGGKIGIFPISYTEPLSSKPLQRFSKKHVTGWARAKYDFIAKNQIELTLNKDDMILLVREVDNNWYEGNLNGKSGIFPISYVEIISESGLSATESSKINSAKDGINKLDLNKNNIENIDFEKASPVSELLPTRNNLSKLNIAESEYNNNRVSPSLVMTEHTTRYTENNLLHQQPRLHCDVQFLHSHHPRNDVQLDQ